MNFEEPEPIGKPRKEKPVKSKAAEPAPKPAAPPPAPPEPKPEPRPEPKREETVVPLEAAELIAPGDVHAVPPPSYNLWEKMSPSARRKKQIATMEMGSREVLALVRSIRENMEQQLSAQRSLIDSLQHLPEAVAGIQTLTEQHSEMLEMMNQQMGNSHNSTNRFNDTLLSMDQTTQLLLERAQRSEQQLFGMLRRSQRRLFVLMLLTLLLFFGGTVALLNAMFPEQVQQYFPLGGGTAAAEAPVTEQEPEAEPQPAVMVPPEAEDAFLPEELPVPPEAVGEMLEEIPEAVEVLPDKAPEVDAVPEVEPVEESEVPEADAMEVPVLEAEAAPEVEEALDEAAVEADAVEEDPEVEEESAEAEAEPEPEVSEEEAAEEAEEETESEQE